MQVDKERDALCDKAHEEWYVKNVADQMPLKEKLAASSGFLDGFNTASNHYRAEIEQMEKVAFQSQNAAIDLAQQVSRLEKQVAVLRQFAEDIMAIPKNYTGVHRVAVQHGAQLALITCDKIGGGGDE